MLCPGRAGLTLAEHTLAMVERADVTADRVPVRVYRTPDSIAPRYERQLKRPVPGYDQ